MVILYRIIFVVALFIVWASKSKAQLVIPQLVEFQKALKDYTGVYTMKCIYPDSQVYDVKGRIAIKGNSYYDSSNLRYAMLNKKWLIIADHIAKEITVSYIEGINKELEGFASVNASSYLLDDELLYESATIELLNNYNDSVLYRVMFKDQPFIKYIDILISKNNYHPLKYIADIRYPAAIIGGDEGEYISLNIECSNIVSPSPSQLFDESRVLEKNNKKIHLKKFNTYKTY